MNLTAINSWLFVKVVLRFLKSYFMRLLLSLLAMVTILFLAEVNQANATLRQPLFGAQMQSKLTPEQYEVALLYMALQSQGIQKSSLTHDEALKAIESVHDLIKIITDSKDFFEKVVDKSYQIMGYNSVLTSYLTSEHQWMRAYEVKRNRKVLVLLCATTQVINSSFPGLGLQDSVVGVLLPALSNNDPQGFAKAIDNLLNPSSTVGFIGSTLLAVLGDVVDNLDIVDSISYEDDIRELFSKGNIFSRVKTLGPSFYATKAISITNDLLFAAASAANDSNTMAKAMAYEFLNYYFITYGGDFSAFYGDLGLPLGTPVETAYKTFINTPDPNGPTASIKQRFSSSFAFFDVTELGISTTAAVSTIRNTLLSSGLALRPGFQADGSNVNSLDYGKPQTVKFCLDPMLIADDYSLGNSMGIIFSDLQGPFGGSVDIPVSSYCGSYQTTIQKLGRVNLSVSYKVIRNNAVAYDASAAPKDFIRYVYVKDSDISLSGFNISAFTQQLGGANNTESSIKVTLAPGLFTKSIFTPSKADLSYADFLGASGVSCSIEVYDNIKGIRIVPRQDFSLDVTNNVVIPISSISAFNMKSGNVGDYTIRYTLYHPYLTGGIKTGQFPLKIDYTDLGGDSFLSPYLLIQVPDISRAAFDSSNNTFNAQLNDIISLKAMNMSPSPFSETNLKDRPLRVVVWLPNGESAVLPAGLVGDSIQFTISGTSLDGKTLTQGQYQVVTVFYMDESGTSKKLPIDVSMPMQLIQSTRLDFVTTAPSPAGTIVIPRTGQYRCYDDYGNDISCVGTGQDGDVQAGKPWSQVSRFKDNNDETIVDTVTGIVWTKDGNAPGPLSCNPGTSKNWQSALDYVDCLNNNFFLNHNDWRLPNRNELNSIIDHQQGNQALWLNSVGFVNIQTSTYWTSSTVVDYPDSSWIVSMLKGYVFSDDKISSSFVWPIRGGDNGGDIQLSRTGQSTCYNSSGAIIDCATLGQTQDAAMNKGVSWNPVNHYISNNDGTVTDSFTGLIWLQNANCTDTVGGVNKVTGKLGWSDALTWSKNLASGSCGLSDGSVVGDWRLPNINELNSLSDISYTCDSPQNFPFTITLCDLPYWSSSQVVDSFDPAMNLSKTWITTPFRSSGVGGSVGDFHAWAVRGGYLDKSKITPRVVNLISENLPDGIYQVGATTKIWRFKNGAVPIYGLKAVMLSGERGLGITQSEIVIGDVAANAEFLVQLPINADHDSNYGNNMTLQKASYWNLVDKSLFPVTIANSSTNKFWLKIATNRSPEFSKLQLESIAGRENQEICISIVASDPDGDYLYYNVSPNVGKISSETTGNGPLITKYCNSFPVGIHAITITAADGYGGSASTTIQAVITSGSYIKDFYNDVKFADATTQTLKDQYMAINYLTANGITIGYPVDPSDPSNLARVFNPSGDATQAEALAVIMKSAIVRGAPKNLALDVEPRWLGNLVVVDVDKGIFKNYSWATPYVLKAEALGMIPSADSFDPAAVATREWTASIVARMLRLRTPMDVIDPATYTFADSGQFTTPVASRNALAVAYFGYMVGETGSTVSFRPLDSLSRADMAVVASKILRTPTADAIETTGLTLQTLYEKQLPSVVLGQPFTVTGLTNLMGHQIEIDSNGNVTDGITNSSNYTTVKIIQPGLAVMGTRLAYNLTNSPIVVPTSIPDITYSVERSIVAVLESVDWDGRNPVRNIVRLDYGVLFPDADGDGVRDSLDLWPNNPFYATGDVNGNGIPDVADTMWGLSNRNSSDVVNINGQSMTLIDAVLNNALANDSSAPITTSSLAEGVYYSAQKVILTTNETATIRYTVDGSVPNYSSQIYSSPIDVNSTTTIQFFSTDLAGNAEPLKGISITITALPINSINGVCGTSNKQQLPSIPLTDLCSTGTASDILGTGPWSWSCVGSNGGKTASCSAQLQLIPINGTCGSSNGVLFTSAPTTGLCSSGTVTGFVGTGPWYWMCAGNNGGSNANCAAVTAGEKPTLVLGVLSDGATVNLNTLNISGIVNSPNGIKSLVINGTQVTPIADGSFSFAISLTAGANVITTTVTDLLDIQNSDVRTIYLDLTAPSLTVSAPADNSITSQSTVTVTGTLGEVGIVQVRVNNGSLKTITMNGSDPNFSLTADLAPGYNSLEITGTDAAGNSTRVRRSIKSDTSKPVLAINDPGYDITTSRGQYVLKGIAIDPDTSVTVKVECDGKTYFPAMAGENFEQQLIFGTEKQYAVIVTATDLVGNVTTVQRNIIYSKAGAGDLNMDGKVDIRDALKALQIAISLISATPSDLAIGDVGPFVNNQPAPDGRIDISDAVLILERSVGLMNW